MQVISDENHMVGAIFYGLKILFNENECDLIGFVLTNRDTRTGLTKMVLNFGCPASI